MSAADAGLAVARTSLAWGRTALALLAYAALVAHAGVVAERPALLASAVLPAVGAGGLYAVGRGRAGGRRPAGRLASAVAVTALALAAFPALLATALLTTALLASGPAVG